MEGFSAGALVGGRYRLERELGRGGMGEVWAATHTVTSRRVALKILLSREPRDARSHKRFELEARAACLIQHPNVIAVHDFFFDGDAGNPIMVMDLLEGETLHARLARRGTLSLPEAADVMVQVVSAVATAHANGVIHRDLKPENIFIVRSSTSETVKVLDFGVAKLTIGDASTGGLTETGDMIGTPFYMAPEQLLGERTIDHGCDVWALGTIFYEMLSGTRPFDGHTPADMYRKLLGSASPELGCRVPNLPPSVGSLVARMLERDRERRLANLNEVLGVLRPFASVPARPVNEQSDVRRKSLIPSIVSRGKPFVATEAQPIPRTKGMGLRSCLPLVKERFGNDALLRAIRSIPDDVHPKLDLNAPHYGILSSTWYDTRIPATIFDYLLANVPELEHGDLAAKLARASLDYMMNGVYAKLFKVMATPALYARHNQRIWDTYYNTGKVTVTQLTPTMALHQVRDWTGHHPFVCRMNRQGGACVYSMMGLKRVRIEREQCSPPLCEAVYAWDEK